MLSLCLSVWLFVRPSVCDVVQCGWTIHPTAKVSEQMNRKCPLRNKKVQLSSHREPSNSRLATHIPKISQLYDQLSQQQMGFDLLQFLQKTDFSSKFATKLSLKVPKHIKRFVHYLVRYVSFLTTIIIIIIIIYYYAEAELKIFHGRWSEAKHLTHDWIFRFLVYLLLSVAMKVFWQSVNIEWWRCNVMKLCALHFWTTRYVLVSHRCVIKMRFPNRSQQLHIGSQAFSTCRDALLSRCLLPPKKHFYRAMH